MMAMALCACQSGSGDPVAPVPGSGSETVDDYPPAPYGINPGDVIRPLCFPGYVNPLEGIGPDFEREICLDQFFNPTDDASYEEGVPFEAGAPKPRVVMINVAAVWCGPCKEEAATILPKEYAEYGPRGMELLSILTDSAEPGSPATLDNLDAWVSAFSSGYPSVIDPDYGIGGLIDTTQYPANLLIDTTDMTIAVLVVGKPGASFFTKLEELLED